MTQRLLSSPSTFAGPQAAEGSRSSTKSSEHNGDILSKSAETGRLHPEYPIKMPSLRRQTRYPLTSARQDNHKKADLLSVIDPDDDQENFASGLQNAKQIICQKKQMALIATDHHDLQFSATSSSTEPYYGGWKRFEDCSISWKMPARLHSFLSDRTILTISPRRIIIQT